MSGPFINASLLDKVAYGFQMGPDVGDVRIKRQRNQHERRNRGSAEFLWRGNAPYKRITPANYEVLLGAFLSAWGPWSAFRFRNWLDDNVSGQPLGLAPAGRTPVQLVRDYTLFGGVTHRRTVTKPVASTVEIFEAGLPKPGVADELTGLFVPDADWVEGQLLTGTFQFDIPVRFTTTFLPFDYADFKAISADVGIKEVFGE